MEWDLVCGRASLSPFFQSFYFFGTAVGEPLMGLFADRFGRRWVISVSALLFLLTSVTSALVPLYSLVLAGRFVLGALHAIIGPAYIQGMEACPVNLRTVFGLLATTPFALTGMLFGAWAYLIRDWRTLQLVCAAPTLLFIILIPFVDESPRWLMQKGRLQEAANNLLKGARWQGATLPTQPELVNLLEKFRLESADGGQEHQQITRNEGCASRCWRETTLLVRTPALRRITIGLFGCWFFTGVTFWGMSLSGTSFSSDPFLYMVLSSLMEIPGYSGFTPIVARFGRRFVLSFNFAVCSCAILTILATPASYTWMIFALALVGKLFITGSYGLLYLVSSELFPTTVRSRGLNLSSMMARFGSIMSPFVIKLLASTYWWAPSVLFGMGAGLGTLFALLLPESSNKPMADTVDQLELLYGSSSRTSSSNSIEKGVASPLTAPEREGEADV
ncbi:organic cation transporter protein-like isoform X2 [Scylla paramamosain]